MKWLKYTFKTVVAGTDKDGNPTYHEVLSEARVRADEKGRELAEWEAVGEIVEFEDDTPDEPVQSTDADRIAALEEQLAAAKILLGVE